MSYQQVGDSVQPQPPYIPNSPYQDQERLYSISENTNEEIERPVVLSPMGVLMVSTSIVLLLALIVDFIGFVQIAKAHSGLLKSGVGVKTVNYGFTASTIAFFGVWSFITWGYAGDFGIVIGSFLFIIAIFSIGYGAYSRVYE